MEYMVFADGSVKVYELIDGIFDVFDELQKQGAIAYYWRDSNLPYEWKRIDTYTHSVSWYSGQLLFSDVILPDVIKLATMLE